MTVFQFIRVQIGKCKHVDEKKRDINKIVIYWVFRLYFRWILLQFFCRNSFHSHTHVKWHFQASSKKTTMQTLLMCTCTTCKHLWIFNSSHNWCDFRLGHYTCLIKQYTHQTFFYDNCRHKVCSLKKIVFLVKLRKNRRKN